MSSHYKITQYLGFAREVNFVRKVNNLYEKSKNKGEKKKENGE